MGIRVEKFWNDLEISKKKSGYDLQPLKRLHILLFNTTLILYASLIFTPLTPTDYDLEAGSCTDGLFPVLSTISSLTFQD